MVSDLLIAVIFLVPILGMLIAAIVVRLKTPTYKPSKREVYNKYIHSNRWRRRRVRALIIGGHRCALCNNRNELQVHHLSYEHLGKEKDYELQVLCHGCHQEVHNRKF